ncbi:hypothetical protein IWQ55_006518 [Labrenzia sp. EL_208]|nr:hypothetical protein [Labrenzia sp. EL_132]MBG6233278.1 hypothetical protein [Labrenzia sp. EL_208]
MAQVILIGEGEEAPAPPGDLKHFKSKDTLSKFGYKAEEIDNTWFWIAGTEEYFRSSEAKRLNIDPAEVDLANGCFSPGTSNCIPCGHKRCERYHDPDTNLYYCVCRWP